MLSILLVDAYAAHRKVVQKLLLDMRPDERIDHCDPIRQPLPQGIDSYDLIMMDSKMGDLDGIEVFESIQLRAPDVPVIFLSSQNNVDVAVRAMKAGAQDFVLKKGIKPSRLRSLVNAVLPEMEQPLTDMMPNMKPMPEHHQTTRYEVADTQILPSQFKQQANIQSSEESDDEEYWDQQTQILYNPPQS